MQKFCIIMNFVYFMVSPGNVRSRWTGQCSSVESAAVGYVFQVNVDFAVESIISCHHNKFCGAGMEL